jgi:hypothetical protein
MDGATLQARIYAAYGKASGKIGQTYDVYRPDFIKAPLNNLVAIVTAAFDSSPQYGFKAPNGYGDALWSALLDGSLTQVGDYLIGNNQTFFIAAQQSLLPIMVVECNRTVGVNRQHQQSGAGVVGYGGDTVAGQTVLMNGWPASILMGARSEKSEAGLPDSTKSPSWKILMPHFSGVTLRTNDIITDDLSRRYIISGAELTDLGWRINAIQATN